MLSWISRALAVLEITPKVALLRSVTGWDVAAEELRTLARRVVTAKKLYNVREGWTPAEDTLPARLLDAPLTLPSGREAVLSRERLDEMIAAYHETRMVQPWP